MPPKKSAKAKATKGKGKAKAEVEDVRMEERVAVEPIQVVSVPSPQEDVPMAELTPQPPPTIKPGLSLQERSAKMAALREKMVGPTASMSLNLLFFSSESRQWPTAETSLRNPTVQSTLHANSSVSKNNVI